LVQNAIGGRARTRNGIYEKHSLNTGYKNKAGSEQKNELPRRKRRGINPCPPVLWPTRPPVAD